MDRNDDVITFISNNFKTICKGSKKLKELEIMCQDAIYICISWYSKI